MCSHYESEFKDVLKGWGVPIQEWKTYAEVYREWKTEKEAQGNVRAGIDPTKEGLVIKADGTVVKMRWGYMRQRERADGKGLKAAAPTVNARSEKVANAHSMWYESWKAGRRCIVPVSAFYEWTYPGGKMLTHRFHMDGQGFGVAGLWEDSVAFGPCYTLLTTVPNREVVIRGERDPIVPQTWTEKVARLIPDSKSVTIPHVAHAVNFSAAKELVRKVMDFLAGVQL